MEFDSGFLIREAKDAIRRYYHSSHDPSFCLDHARRNFEEAIENSSDPTATLEALIGLSHTYGYLADVDAPACTNHAQVAVATAERALAHFQENFQDKTPIEARVHDALGCALLQRYVYLAAMEDCDHAIAAHRKALELTTSDDTPIARSVRRSHLVRALYMRSRGSRHDKTLHKRSLLEAVGMSRKYECNGANIPFTPITGGLLFLCGRLLADERAQESKRPMVPDNSTLPEAEDEPQSIETQLKRTIQVMESNYDMIARVCGPQYTRFTAELGSFSAYNLKASTPDHTDDSGARYGAMLQALTDGTLQLDLRHATLLMDILHTLVTDNESMVQVDTQISSLVHVICQRLHRMLPKSHMERPELHYLLGKHLSSSRGESSNPRSQNMDPVIQFRKALELTPSSHPSQAPYLLSLIAAQLGLLDGFNSGAQISTMQTSLQEVSRWTNTLRTLAKSPDLSPTWKKHISRMLVVLERAQDDLDPTSGIQLKRLQVF